MKVNIIKPHPFYELGEMEIKDDPERVNYLIRVGVAEEVKEAPEEPKTPHKKAAKKTTK